MSSAVYSILVPSPKTYLEYQIILDQVAELNDDFDLTVSKLKERYEARDFRELDCLLGGWTFPRAYPEYQSFSNQAAELAKGFEGTESKLRKCSAARDFRVLSRLLESWTFPTSYPEYERLSNEVQQDASLWLDSKLIAAHPALPRYIGMHRRIAQICTVAWPQAISRQSIASSTISATTC